MAHNNIPNIGDALTNLPDPKKPKDRTPNPTKHLYVSLIKSGLRILAGSCIIAAGYSGIYDDNWFIAAGALFVGAEFLGIVEELV